ncbi:MAG TPA: N-acetylglucosamine-6-phosphate deacetylase [Novosphingobium sp.]
MTSLLVENGTIATAGAPCAAAVITLEDGRIAAIHPGPGVADRRIDLAGGWLLPGFVDVQVNGGGGVLFNDQTTPDAIARIGAAHARFGTTAFLPTLITDTPAAIARALDAVDQAIASGVPSVVGVHIEGPVINPVRKGIHASEKIRRLDTDTLALLCQPRRGITVLTLAPECVAHDDLAALTAAGVLICAGHTDATYDDAAAGFASGIRGVTHLFNAMSPFTHRAPGMVGAALLDDAVWCGLIADGIHAAAPALQLALKVKGPDRIMLVTDAMPGVGLDSGSFQLDGRTITIENGMCTDAAGTLAGSNLDMASALRTMVALGGADILTAGRMASATPAAFLGLDAERGSIAPGLRADLVVLDAGLRVRQTWIGGNIAWQS